MTARTILQSLRRRGSLAIVLTAAAGMFAAQVVFSIQHTLMRFGLNYPDPDRLVSIEHAPLPQKTEGSLFSGAACLDWMKVHSVMQSLGCYETTDMTRSVRGRQSATIKVARTTASVFEVLGVAPLAGRPFAREDERSEFDVVVISESFWRTQLGGSEDAIGSFAVLDGRSARVVGVMPRRFQFPDAIVQAWVPLDPRTQVHRTPDGQVKVSVPQVRIVGRLTAGRSAQDARAEGERTLAGQPILSVRSLHDEQVRHTRRPVVALRGALLLLLLIVCVNLSTLHLAQDRERARAHAIRAALGASRMRLIGGALGRSMTLTLVGGLSGVCAATSVMNFLGGMHDGTAYAHLLRVDARSVFACTAMATLTSLIASLAPAARLSRTNIVETLGLKTPAWSRGNGRFPGMAGMVGLLVALSLAMLSGAMMLVDAFSRVVSADLGFVHSGLIAIDVKVPSSLFPTAASRALVLDGLLANAHDCRGLRNAALTSDLPLKGGRDLFSFGGQRPEGISSFGKTGRTRIVTVSQSYFATMQIPLTKGRSFGDQDRGSGLLVAILSRSAAQRDFQGRDPIGEQFRSGRQAWTIVGVAGDVVDEPLRASASPTVYLPYFQVTDSGDTSLPTDMTLVARAVHAPGAATSEFLERVEELDPRVIVGEAGVLDARLYRALGELNSYMTLMALVACVALGLASLGVFSTLSRAVAGRRLEIAVKLAIGAAPNRVFGGIVGDGMRVVGMGAMAGLPLTWATNRVLSSSFEFTVSPSPSSMGIALAVLAFSSLAACIQPAVRAMRVEPASVLKSE